MLMDSEANRLLFIVALFLCVGGMFIWSALLRPC